MNGQLNEHPFAAKVGSLYYSYARGYQETVEVNDPCSLGYIPTSRFGHCAALIDNKWYLLGGVSCPLSFVEVYDVCHQRWRRHAALGDIPEASFGAACTVLQGRMYVFGGRTRDMKYSNDLSELDVETMVWKRLEPGNSCHVPILKKDAAMVSHGRCLVTFGGCGILHEHVKRSRASYGGNKKEVWTNELIKYDLDKSKYMWTSQKRGCVTS